MNDIYNLAKSIRIASDLHMESHYGFPMVKLVERFLPEDDRDSESILVLAGDISSKVDQLFEFISHIEDRFYHVVYVPGNHEYYGKEMSKWCNDSRNAFSVLKKTSTPFDGVEEYTISGIRFIVGTLWGECSLNPNESFDIKRSIADFHYIYNNGTALSVTNMIDISQIHRGQIRKFLWDDTESKTVVVTHHMPSYQLVADQFKMSAINGAFVNPIDDDLEASFAPDLWIHGHTHSTIDKHIDIRNGTMRVICNPHGYRHEVGQHDNSYQKKFININEL